MNVVYFFRKPVHNFFSIEELFGAIQKELGEQLEVKICTMPYPNKGTFNRMKNMLFAWRNRGDINHITGDIHYLGIVLPASNTVLTIHDCGEHSPFSRMKRRLFWFFWYYWPVRRLKYVTVISQYVKEYLLGFVKTNPSKIHVIYNCLIGEYQPKKKPFNARKPRILQVGFTPNKNLSRIIPAIKDISCTLVILGHPRKEDIEVLEKNSIDFEIHNKLTRKQVAGLYAACDMLLYPSTFEGFGLPIIEAQASGLPVITGNIFAMPETAGEGACLVDPFSVDAIRAAVLKVIRDDHYRESLITKGFENFKRFDVQLISSQYLQLYEQIYRNTPAVPSPA